MPLLPRNKLQSIFLEVKSVLPIDSKIAILNILELHHDISIPEISELSKISELECSSALAHLVTGGYVQRFGDKFRLSFHGKQHLDDLRK